MAAAIAPATLRSLSEQGLVRRNYRGHAVACPAGVVVVAAAVLALIPLSLIDEAADEGVFAPGTVMACVYVLGVALLGLVDDLVGSGAHGERPVDAPAPPRGLRGHTRAALGGRASTGALKAAGALGLALFAVSEAGPGDFQGFGRYLLAVAVLVLATNLFNLLDLRPGRAIKVFLVLALGLAAGTRDLHPLWALGAFVGPVLALFPHDLRERGMLGDAGSNAIGAIAGLWLVLALEPTGQAVALAALLLITLYGEFRSISALVERIPLLRLLDSAGRPTHA